MEFIKKLNLGGAMIWAIDLDDSQGVCGTEFPLLRKVYSVLCGEQENVPATSYNEAMKLAPGIQSASLYRVQIPILSSSPLYMQIKVPFSPIHKQPALEVRPALYIADVYNKVCQTNGYHRDPTHCSGFFVCDKGHLRKFTCPFNLKFNEATFTCDWSQYPGCDEPQLSPTPGFQCPGDGLYPNPEKCEAYYICANNEATPMVCTSNTVFNPVNKICDWPRNVICNQRPGPPSPPVLPPPEPPVFPILPQPGPPPIFPILPQPGQPDPVTFPPPFPSTKVTEPLTIPTRRHPFPTTSHRPWTEPTTTRWQPWGGEWTQPTTKGPEFTHRPHVRPPG